MDQICSLSDKKTNGKTSKSRYIMSSKSSHQKRPRTCIKLQEIGQNTYSICKNEKKSLVVYIVNQSLEVLKELYNQNGRHLIWKIRLPDG